MYAQILRKFNFYKFQMYLWLPIIIFLLYWCQGASTMHLTSSQYEKKIIKPDELIIQQHQRMHKSHHNHHHQQQQQQQQHHTHLHSHHQQYLQNRNYSKQYLINYQQQQQQYEQEQRHQQQQQRNIKNQEIINNDDEDDDDIDVLSFFKSDISENKQHLIDNNSNNNNNKNILSGVDLLDEELDDLEQDDDDVVGHLNSNINNNNNRNNSNFSNNNNNSNNYNNNLNNNNNNNDRLGDLVESRNKYERFERISTDRFLNNNNNDDDIDLSQEQDISDIIENRSDIKKINNNKLITSTINYRNRLKLQMGNDNQKSTGSVAVSGILSGRNRRESRLTFQQQQQQQHQQQQQQQQQHQQLHNHGRIRQKRYCSARDPTTLAYDAFTVFEGKLISKSRPVHNNFSATFEVIEIFKKQDNLKLPHMLRLQFQLKNTNECDIYRESLRSPGYIREGLETHTSYILFVRQIDLGNFTILGQPIKKTRRVVNDVKIGVSEKYGQRASIESLTSNLTSREGKRIRLVCKVAGQPPPKVTWFKDGRSISRNRNRFLFIHLRRRSEFIIKSATTNDTGKYECRAKNKFKSTTNNKPVSRTTEIEVLAKENTTKIHPIWKNSGSPCPTIGGNEYCLNGGTCVYFKDVGEPACNCPDGFMGNRCETKNPSNLQPNPTSDHYNDPYMMDAPLQHHFDDDNDDEDFSM